MNPGLSKRKEKKRKTDLAQIIQIEDFDRNP